MFYLFAFIYGIVALYDVSSFANLSPFCGRSVPGVRFSAVHPLVLVWCSFYILYSSSVWLHNEGVVWLNAA